MMARDAFDDLRRLSRAVERGDDQTVDDLTDTLPDLVAALERVFGPEGPPVVAIESPYAGDVEANTRFARECLLDSLTRGEAPFAGHLLYTQVLADLKPTERELGILSHLAYVRRSERVVVYEDLGISSGMQRAIDFVTKLGIPIERRWLY